MAEDSLFYYNFIKLTNARGTSPHGATKKVGLSDSTAANWRANGTVPKMHTLEALAECLECNVSDFFKTDAERADEAVSDEAILAEIDDNVRDFIFIYKNCTNRQRNMLMQTVYDFEREVLNP